MSSDRDKLGRTSLTDREAAAEERARAKANRDKAKLRGTIRALKDEVGVLEERQDFLDRLAEAPDPKPYRVRKLPGQRPQDSPATYVMCASDWHVGERVRPENVGFKNEFNPEIAQERGEQFWKSQLIMLNAARAAWNIRQGVLWLGGDLITGYIHEEYLEENYLSPTEEALLAYEMIVSGIKTLLAKSDLDRIHVVTSNGNHGRTTKKPRVSTAAKNSYEWLLYQFLRMAFEEEPRLTWQIATGYHNVVDLYGFRVNFHHGDKIGYQGGIGGTTIPANRRIHRRQHGIPQRFEGTPKGATHLDVFGHFHTLMYPGSFIQNGSLIGWNDFADSIGAGFEDPKQCSFVVDDRFKVVSNFNPILVDKKSKK